MDFKDYAWQEPVSDYKSQYPYNEVKQTESGHFQEFDDTPGAERIRTQHRTGTFTEIQADGSEVHRVVSNNFTIIAKNNNVLIKGVCNITIEGDSVLDIHGDCVQRVQGNFEQMVEGDYSVFAKGEVSILSGGDLNLNSVGALGAVYLQASDRLVLNSDLTVHGEVLADSISSTGAVTAGTGIHAGVPGSANPIAGISTLGGVNVGLPGPTVPGVVNATTMVTAPLVIGYVMVYGGMLMDPLGGAPLIRTIYDTHIHPTPKGPSGLPIPMMPLP